VSMAVGWIRVCPRGCAVDKMKTEAGTGALGNKRREWGDDAG